MSTIYDKSFDCMACDRTIKTYTYMRKHLKSNRHKKNVVKKYPETLLCKKIDDIIMYTGRLDLTKVKKYINPIEKIKKNNKKQKENKNISLDKQKYIKQYFHKTKKEMITLIKKFSFYLKQMNIDPDDWFNYKYFLNNQSIDDIEEIYEEVRYLVLDDSFMNAIKKEK